MLRGRVRIFPFEYFAQEGIDRIVAIPGGTQVPQSANADGHYRHHHSPFKQQPSPMFVAAERPSGGDRHGQREHDGYVFSAQCPAPRQPGQQEPASRSAVHHRPPPSGKRQCGHQCQGNVVQRGGHLVIDTGRQHDRGPGDPSPGASNNRGSQHHGR